PKACPDLQLPVETLSDVAASRPANLPFPFLSAGDGARRDWLERCPNPPPLTLCLAFFRS
ncbi:hypothetical protein A2U01_0074951, partial [Trifolium medium]|nr:hypothetical protein [Trifolium medium]